jgi:hypothetical protein
MASDARRLKALVDENAKRKRLPAEQVLDNAMVSGPRHRFERSRERT